DDLDPDGKTGIRASNRGHRRRKPGKRGETRPKGRIQILPPAIGSLDDTLLDWPAVIVRERGAEARWQQEHIVVLKIFLPDRADAEPLHGLSQPAAVRLHGCGGRNVARVLLEARAQLLALFFADLSVDERKQQV